MIAERKSSNQKQGGTPKHARHAEIAKSSSNEILTHTKIKFKGSKNCYTVDILEANETGFHIAIHSTAAVTVSDECVIEWKPNGNKIEKAIGVVRKIMEHSAITVISIEHRRSMLSRLLFWNK